MSGTPSSIAIDGDYAYISEFISSGVSEARLLKMDISKPRFARVIKVHNLDFGGKTIINNDYLYVSARYDKFRILDISNPNIYVETGLYDSRNPSGTRNAIFDAVVFEKYAYLVVEDVGIQVLDVSDPTQPLLVITYAIDDEIQDISLNKRHVYIATENNGLQVIDVANPSMLIQTGAYESPKSVTKLEVANNLIYAAAEDNGLRIIDASNPKMPFEVGLYQLPEEVRKPADDNDPVYITGVAIEDNQAYLAVKDIGVQLVEISDPSSPIGTAFYPLHNGINDIALNNNLAYISTERNGIESSTSLSDLSNGFGWYNMPYSFVDVAVGDKYTYLLSNDGLLTLDISEPNFFNQVNFYAIDANSINSLVVNSNYVYIASNNGLKVIGLSESRIPNKDQYSNLGGLNLEELVLAENYIYAATSKGLSVLDISNPLQPVVIGSYKTENWTYNLAKAGNYIYLNVDDEGIRVIDVSNPSTPIKVGTYIPASGSVSKITIIDSYAYVAAGSGGLRILDVTNPATPTEIGFLENIGFARDIAIKNNFAYIALSEGLAIVDITNPFHPLIVKHYKLPATPWRQKITLAGDYVYLPAHDDGLWIVNIATPSQPDKIYSYTNIYEMTGIDIQADYAYVAASGDGLRLVNITETMTAAEVGIYEESGVRIQDVAVFENIAYVANLNHYTFQDTKNDLLVIEVLNPSRPVKITSYEFPWNVWGVAVDENYIYVAAGTNGVFIFRIKE